MHQQQQLNMSTKKGLKNFDINHDAKRIRKLGTLEQLVALDDLLLRSNFCSRYMIGLSVSGIVREIKKMTNMGCFCLDF